MSETCRPPTGRNLGPKDVSQSGPNESGAMRTAWRRRRSIQQWSYSLGASYEPSEETTRPFDIVSALHWTGWGWLNPERLPGPRGGNAVPLCFSGPHQEPFPQPLQSSALASLLWRVQAETFSKTAGAGTVLLPGAAKKGVPNVAERLERQEAKQVERSLFRVHP